MSKKHFHRCVFPKDPVPGNIYICEVENCKAQLHISSRTLCMKSDLSMGVKTGFDKCSVCGLSAAEKIPLIKHE